MAQKFGLILGGERGGFGFEFRAGFSVQLRRRHGAGGDGNADLGEEIFLSGGRTDTEKTGGFVAGVAELVRRVGGDVKGLAGRDDGLCAAEDGLDFTLQDDEGFLEVVTVRRRPSSGRDVHINQAEASSSVVTVQENCVGVADQADVG